MHGRRSPGELEQLSYALSEEYVLTNEQRTAMNAKIFALSPEVREAALDIKALRRKIKASGDRGYEWLPAEASARQRMVSPSLEQGRNRQKSASATNLHGEHGNAA